MRNAITLNILAQVVFVSNSQMFSSTIRMRMRMKMCLMMKSTIVVSPAYYTFSTIYAFYFWNNAFFHVIYDV